MKSIYREYDIRGVFGLELNEKIVKAIGFYLGERIKAINPNGFVAIGFDAREHSPALFSFLSEGITDCGLNVFNMGLTATGVNYFSNFFEWNFKGGRSAPVASIMITGSHNPPEYNGFKITVDRKPFFGKDIEELGRKISGSYAEYKKGEHKGKIVEIEGSRVYIDYLTNEFANIEGFSEKIAIDCGNGVAGVVLPKILKALDIDSDILFEEPDGAFPNHHPDPSEEHNLEDLKKLMKQKGYKLGFAFDGDADRLAVLTDKYNIKGDELALIFAKQMAKEGKKPFVIGEVKCSRVMYEEINKIGKTLMYKTGHSNLKVKLQETNADFAAEVSGHMFFNDKWFGFDDAIYAAMRVLELVAEGVDLNKEMESMPRLFSTDEIKVKATEESKFEIIERIKSKLQNPPSYLPKILEVIEVDGVRIGFENGWGLVRASNTTPILVTRFEADSKDTLSLYQSAVNKLIEESKN